MTEHQLYKRALEEFDAAVTAYRTTCAKILAGTAADFDANGPLNNVIALGWRLKDAALLREPAPLSRAVQRAAKKKEMGNAKNNDSK